MNKTLLSLTLTALILSGCKKPPEISPAASAAQAENAMPAAAAAQVTAGAFDIQSVPMSTATLGEFPYVKLPEGYDDGAYGKTIDFTRAPLWTGDRVEYVEGKVFMSDVRAKEGKEYSTLEVVRNIDATIKSAGGVHVTESEIPQAKYDEIPQAMRSELEKGLLWMENGSTINTWLIRRADGDIWVQYRHSPQFPATWLIVQAKPLQITASLLPASELKKQIDAAGKVALQVNFATDKTDVLPDSLPQIEQVVALLKEDPALKLAVNGHTDDSGDAAHNQPLSEGRAKAVVALLVGQGIDAARLTAAGFGSAQPVAENTTAEGKAKNRRVELVKR